MPTLISSNASTKVYYDERCLIRDSTDKLVAALNTSSQSNMQPFVSTDNGSSWTAGNTTLSCENGVNAIRSRGPTLAVDSNDVLHSVVTSGSDSTKAIYHQWEIGSGGGVTTHVSAETIMTAGSEISGQGIAIGPNNEVYGLLSERVRSMGTYYYYLHLYERVSGSWSKVTTAYSANSTSADPSGCSCVIDKNGYVHGFAQDLDNTQVLYAKYDISNASVVAEETVYSGSTSYIKQYTCYWQESTGYPIVLVGHEDDVDSNYKWLDIYRRTGSGTWESTRLVTNTEGARGGSVTGVSDEITATVSQSADIYKNQGTWSGLGTSNETAIVTNSNELRYSLGRNQTYNYHSTSDGDLVYHDRTNGRFYYEHVQQSGGSQTYSQPLTETLQFNKNR